MNILFLGDSITDCNHCFTEDNLGTGYVQKLSLLPDVTAVNGGTDGFTFPMVLQKWRRTYARRVFDCVVITCGINDVAMMADPASCAGQAAAFLNASMKALHALLEELICASPLQVPFILLIEPVLFPIPQERLLWLPALEALRSRIQEIVSEFPSDSVRYLPAQSALDDLASRIGPASVAPDGIHPTDAGHECLARLIRDALRL